MGTGFDTIIERALERPGRIAEEELAAMLGCGDASFETALFAAAREVKRRCGREDVLLRGLIETSNVCAKDCLYCGIRRSNGAVARYRLAEPEAEACIAEARRRGCPAVAFQAGEVESEANTAYYETLLAQCRGLEVTLSLGEQTEEVYRRWKAAHGGIIRYLIRIETSNRELYAKIHPADCSFDRRLACIRTLKRLGYVTGSGVMIGLPGQSLRDLARDIVFFAEERLDMVGMGPYIPDARTPMGALGAHEGRERAERLRLSLRMIALTRLFLHDVNIVSATALEALDPACGRRRGLDAGANVVMPVLTPTQYARHYDLYPGKADAGGTFRRASDSR